MRNIWTIAKKEYNSFFHSAIAYVIGVVIFLSLGIYFYILLSYGVQSQSYVPEITLLLDWVLFPLFFISVPILTMRTISDENRTGTLELIMTAPVRDWELVVGKWLGTYLFFLTILAITWIYPFVLNFMVDPGIDQSMLIAVYLGVSLITAAMTAIGVCISSIFKNPVPALIASLGVLILFWIIASPANYMTGFFADLLRYLSITEHYYSSFYYGTIDLTDTIYYVSLTILALFMGTRVIEARRWK
jgi:ABC-2 type transport system permease protein